MNQSIITVRYAKAFFSLAKEKALLDILKKEIELIGQISDESAEFILLIESPVVKTSKKIKLLTELFSESLNKLTVDFLLLVTKNKRESHIPDICRHFLSLVREDQGIKSAIITTACEMPVETISRIKELLEKELDTKVDLSEKVNQDLIGGLLLRIDDKQLDASVATQLKKIRSKLMEA